MQYISCKVCGSDKPKYLGIRGNLEYTGASLLISGEEHIVTNVVQCRKCGFVYTNPFILESNHKGYAEPDEYLPSADGVDPRELFNRTISLIERYIVKRGALLDIGCGKGEFLSLAKDKGWHVYGIEPSEKLANYAVVKYGLDVKDCAENARFQDSFFDVVTLNMVLEHLDEPKAVLKEVNRVLKDNGLLFIEVPNTDGLMLKLASIYFKLKRKNWSPLLSPLHHPFHSYGYNMLSLKYLLKSAGFKIKKFIVTDTSLRGLRISPSANKLEGRVCRMAGKMAGLIGRGDVLIALAEKFS